MRYTQRTFYTMLSAVLVAAGACRGVEPGVAPVPPTSAVPFVTADVQGALNASGQFVLQHGALSATYPEITESRAQQLALGLLRRFGDSWRDMLNHDRGGVVHLASLQPCAHAFYAATPYDSPPEGTHPFVRKVNGPQWLVPLCSGGVEEVLIAVSAYATDAALDSRGRLSQAGLANFFAQGIPLGVTVPISPEYAAEAASHLSGRKVSAVPYLLMRPHPYGGAFAVWQIELEAPARLHAATRTRSLSELYVGYADSWTAQLLATDSSAVPTTEDRTIRFPLEHHLQSVSVNVANSVNRLEPIVGGAN